MALALTPKSMINIHRFQRDEAALPVANSKIRATMVFRKIQGETVYNNSRDCEEQRAKRSKPAPARKHTSATTAGWAQTKVTRQRVRSNYSGVATLYLKNPTSFLYTHAVPLSVYRCEKFLL